jgi:hypothetical protein
MKTTFHHYLFFNCLLLAPNIFAAACNEMSGTKCPGSIDIKGIFSSTDVKIRTLELGATPFYYRLLSKKTFLQVKIYLEQRYKFFLPIKIAKNNNKIEKYLCFQQQQVRLNNLCKLMM